MGRSQRTKGAAGERAIANALKPTFSEARRGIGQARAGGDVPDVDGVPGCWIEVKFRKVANTTTILDAIEQASIATDGRTPVVVVKSDREHPIVCMRLDDWIVMYSAANDQRQDKADHDAMTALGARHLGDDLDHRGAEPSSGKLISATPIKPRL